MLSVAGEGREGLEGTERNAALGVVEKNVRQMHQPERGGTFLYGSFRRLAPRPVMQSVSR